MNQRLDRYAHETIVGVIVLMSRHTFGVIPARSSPCKDTVLNALYADLRAKWSACYARD